MSDPQPGVIRIGEVVTGAFEAIGARPWVLIPAALLFALVPALSATLTAEFTLQHPGTSNLRLLIPYLQLPFAAAFSAFVTRVVVAKASGGAESVLQSVAEAFRVLFPLIALQVLVLIATALGAILLIVPGVIIALAWSVATPVRVSEPISIIGALQRSADLTRGQRLRILGLFLIYFAFALAISFASRELGIGYAKATGFQTDLDSMVVLAIASLITSGTRLIVITGTATLYLALRRAKEGAAEADIAKVFS